MPSDPWAINASAGAPSYTAAELRRIFSALIAPAGAAGTNRFDAVDGIRVGSGVVSSLSAGTITVRAHAGVISPALSSTQGPYIYQLSADETHTQTAAHATLARVDLVYIQVSDHDEDASGARTVASGYLAGTAGAGAPSLPARSFEIARLAVPASPGSASLTERQAFTVAAGGILPVRDATDMAALTGYEGQAIYRLDLNALLAHDGTAFRTLPSTGEAGGLIEFVPGSNTDSSTSALFVTWITLGNVTVPAWATAARYVATVAGSFGVTSTSSNQLQVNVGAVADATTPEFFTNTSERRGAAWQGRVTGLSTGSQSVVLKSARAAGTGVARVDTASQIAVSFTWEP